MTATMGPMTAVTIYNPGAPVVVDATGIIAGRDTFAAADAAVVADLLTAGRVVAVADPRTADHAADIDPAAAAALDAAAKANDAAKPKPKSAPAKPKAAPAAASTTDPQE